MKFIKLTKGNSCINMPTETDFELGDCLKYFGFIYKCFDVVQKENNTIYMFICTNSIL